MMEFSVTDKLLAVRREIKMRKRVYPAWVQEGRLTDGYAAAQIAVMEAIAADYEKLAAGERLI